MRHLDFRSCLFLFNDDSSLISAVKASKLFSRHEILPFFAYVTRSHYVTVSDRQTELILGRTADFSMSIAAILNPNFLGQFDFVYSAKYVKQVQDQLKSRNWGKYPRRPVFLSVFPGLELLPDLGLNTRAVADVLCFNSMADLERARAQAIAGPCAAVRFSPMLYTELKQAPRPPERVRHLLFVPQNALPQKRAGRQHVAEMIAAIAHRHPDCRITIKVRQETGENTFHTHKEFVPYQRLLSELLPEGRITRDSRTIEEAAQDADAVLTCTSTGGAEALAMGVPAMFYTDYPGARDEQQYEGVQRLFAGSGLQVTREQAIALQVPVATDRWWEDNMTSPQDLRSLLTAMRTVYGRLTVASHC